MHALSIASCLETLSEMLLIEQRVIAQANLNTFQGGCFSSESRKLTAFDQIVSDQ
jgi:hypothetical protein